MDSSKMFQWMPAMRRSNLRMLPLLVCIIAMAACGDGDSPTSTTTPLPPAPTSGAAPTPPPASGTTQPPVVSATVFQGTIAGAGRSGALEVTLQAAVAPSSGSRAASPVLASGNLQLIGGGGSVGLSGIYEDSTREVTLSGGGFTFTGGVSEDGAELSGTFSDQGRSGGSFSTRNASAAAVTTYCGTYSGSYSGTWNLVASDGRVSGAYSGTGGSGRLRGTLQGQSVSGSVTDGSLTGTYSGTRQGQSMRGTWRDSEGNSGTFTGSTPCR